uniref:Uncharacterized protein n=1 Tax=Picea glauca TaxID=3330 RepID=A0A101LYA3_PICGL|nr:hypothetical protein ABT39_MTgene5745 [Picea glauca]KUM50209.1 hypothetical protein ABT39_MTgene52 [Picea glauca]
MTTRMSCCTALLELVGGPNATYLSFNMILMLSHLSLQPRGESMCMWGHTDYSTNSYTEPPEQILFITFMSTSILPKGP